MGFYSKYILPRYLNLTMRSKSFEQDRNDAASNASGQTLEIGFGSGFNLPYYKNVQKLFALDISKELFDLAQGKVQSASFPIEFIQASAEQIPLPDNSCDSVISTWSLCSIPHPETALKEIRRVLKPGGIFSFVEHGKSDKPFIAKIQNLCTPISKKLIGGCHMNRDIESLILSAGFTMQKIEKSTSGTKPLSYTYKGIAIPGSK